MEVSQGKYLTKKEIELLSDEFAKTHFKSTLAFIREHNGFRRKNLHLLLSTTGAGKSTLMRTLVLDALTSVLKGKKVLVYLSEETKAKFKFDIAQSGLLEYGQTLKQRLDIVSEQDCTVEQLNRSYQFLLDKISSDEYDIVFLDNITTARFYTQANINSQVEICDKIKQSAAKGDTAVIIVAHTDRNTTQYTKKIIDPQDIRGLKYLPTITEYIYAMHNFYNNDRRATVFMIIKYRDGNVKNKYWKLEYSPENKLYMGARSIGFDCIKENFKTMDKL